jgi:hypothetical protein
MNCHLDNETNPFLSHSYFTPFKPEPEICPLNDVVPEIVKLSKSNNEVTYLPGEKLLIGLGKQRKKKKEKKNNIDIDRLTESLSRVLGGF